MKPRTTQSRTTGHPSNQYGARDVVIRVGENGQQAKVGYESPAKPEYGSFNAPAVKVKPYKYLRQYDILRYAVNQGIAPNSVLVLSVPGGTRSGGGKGEVEEEEDRDVYGQREERAEGRWWGRARSDGTIWGLGRFLSRLGLSEPKGQSLKEAFGLEGRPCKGFKAHDALRQALPALAEVTRAFDDDALTRHNAARPVPLPPSFARSHPAAVGELPGVCSGKPAKRRWLGPGPQAEQSRARAWPSRAKPGTVKGFGGLRAQA
ncbi:hypothetical protein B0H11DRAFT_1935606 [Mycena galericulata]|nr:hypothetical protein B0H11DRAFT_1935606 [Mycena galericulata]